MYSMKIVAALTDPVLAPTAKEQGADMIELRLDLIEGDVPGLVAMCRKECPLPVIATLRSAAEGGRYFGNTEEWIRHVRPVLAFADYIDVEESFSSHAAEIREAGRTIIASFHTPDMPDLPTLFAIERGLRSYGDIVKIIVTPKTDEDVIELIMFTHSIKQPLCTGVMGSHYRYARAVLPLFGSTLVYCHVGTPTAAGQYSVGEFAGLMKLLGK
jgi:3-dehydroquinate dehydratase-1